MKHEFGQQPTFPMMQKSLWVCGRLVAKLHTFRAEFDSLKGNVAQDVHLSWMFFANRKVSGNEVANAMLALGANDFHTSESEVEQDASTNQTCNVSGTLFCTSSEDEGDWDLASGEQKSPTVVPAKRRRYSKRGSRWGIKLLGEGVCRRAAQALCGVGTQRLQRIRRGEADGREADAKPLGGQLTMLRQSCMTFLWHSYHQVGEVMPDRFSFANQGAAGVFISVQGGSEEKVAWGRAPPGDLITPLTTLTWMWASGSPVPLQLPRQRVRREVYPMLRRPLARAWAKGPGGISHRARKYIYGGNTVLYSSRKIDLRLRTTHFSECGVKRSVKAR